MNGAALRLRPGTASVLSLAVLTLSTALVLSPAVSHAVQLWATTEEFSYGFLIVPIAAAIIWWRRSLLFQSLDRGRPGLGLALIVPSLLAYLVAWRLEVHAVAGIVVSPLLLGIVVFVWGARAGRVLAFPLFFLVFGFGVYRGLLDSVGFALQGITAWGAALLAHGLGIAVERQGLILTSDRFAFIVAEPCSGMSSLVSLLALACLWTFVAQGSLARRAAVILSTAPLVVLANSTRVALVLLVASWWGQDAALGFFHGASSLVLFGLALSGLIAIGRIVGCRPTFSYAR